MDGCREHKNIGVCTMQLLWSLFNCESFQFKIIDEILFFKPIKFECKLLGCARSFKYEQLRLVLF